VQPSRPTWRRRAREIATERLALKGIALAVAALLWVVVSARQPTEGYVRVKVEPDLDSSLVMLDGTVELQALVAGRAADLVKLYAAPLVLRRRVGGDVPDTLVLDVSPADVHIPPELNDAVRVVDVQPRNVVLRFESRATRRVSVVSDGRITVLADSGARPASEVEFEPQTVRVTGPRRVVRQLRGIRPFSLSISNADTLAHVADLDTTGTGVRAEPMQVKVRVRAMPVAVSAPMRSESTPTSAPAQSTAATSP
jgi:YbbR domain-containing protein